MRRLSYLLLGFISLYLLIPATGVKAALPATFNDPAFATTWNRPDRPVSELPGAGRGYTWGPPAPGSAAVTAETYDGRPRKVQYFDKARMEVNDPGGNPNDLFYVTTGLLVKELVTGQRQDGNTSFTPLKPSQVQVAGDDNSTGANALAPTYASFQNLAFGNDNAGRPDLGNALITQKINRDGSVAAITPPESRRLAAYDNVTRHNIADVFVDFGTLSGLIWSGSAYVQGSVLFGQPLYVLGRPLVEPYWARAVVAGTERDVLVQLFERRVLTYTPSNPAGFKVEMGNVGQHYYRWRYVETGQPGGQPGGQNPPPAVQPVDVGIKAITNLYNLPQLGAYGQTYEVSSHEPKGANRDYGNYPYQEGDRYVIFDDWSPGCVYRIWMVPSPIASFASIGRLQFYFDNETTPRVDVPVTDFFSGEVAPFRGPVVGNSRSSSGGFFSYIPLPYAKRLKIATTGVPGYYQVNYRRLPGVDNIQSFTGKEDYTSLYRLFTTPPGTDPKPAQPGRQALTGTVLAEPGKPLSLGGALQGPGLVSALRLKFQTSRFDELLKQTSLRITWEGRDWSQVDAPLDYFFGSAAGAKQVSGLMAGIDLASQAVYFYYPMPFRQSATISLLNNSSSAFTVSWEVDFDPDTGGKLVNAGSGYFNAIYKKEREPAAGKDYNLLDVKGRGRYIGTVMNLYNNIGGIEGDERSYIDGNNSPLQYGTGFEDYFNGAYAFQFGPFSQVLHGNTLKQTDLNAERFASFSVYRFMLGDTVDFNSGLAVGLEHGINGRNETVPNETYTTLAFFYGLDQPALARTDSLTLGDDGSEQAHAYSNSGVTAKQPLTSAYEGQNDEQMLTRTGYYLAGGSRFTLKLDPNNSGVVLRRLLDYYNLNQQANIYVDGQLVGRWYSAGSNSILHWREEDFAIPARFTAGKRQVQVRVEVVAETSAWTEFGYEVYSLAPGLGYLPGSANQ